MWTRRVDLIYTEEEDQHTQNHFALKKAKAQKVKKISRLKGNTVSY